MKFDSSRCLVGIATAFDVPAANDGVSWAAEEFRDFVDAGFPVPLMVNHEPLINSWGITPSIGTARRFAPVEYPVRGLLCLAEVDHADGWGDSILRDVGKALSQEYLPSVWGFSVGVKATEDGQLWLVEVSITRKPAFSDARILACGPDALQTWEFCREMSAATTRAA